MKNWHFWWVPGHENSQISWCHKNLPKLFYSMQNAKLCFMAEFRMKISIISASFATLSKWPKTVINWHFWWVRVMKILKFLDVIKTYQNYLIRCRMPNYASWPSLAWKSPLLVPVLLLCQNDLKKWKIDIFGRSGFMKILKFLDIKKTYQNYLIRCRMPNYASWPNLAWKSPLLVPLLLLWQNDLKQWKIDIFGGSRVMKVLKFLDVIKTYQNYLIRCRMPNYASWPNLAWKSPLLVLFFATLSKWPKTVKNWHFWWVRGHENSQISLCHKNLPKLSYSMQNAKLCIMAEFGVKISIISACFATLSKWPKKVKNWHFW